MWKNYHFLNVEKFGINLKIKKQKNKYWIIHGLIPTSHLRSVKKKARY